MSTSDNAGEFSDAARAAGLPDASTLEQMANQYLRQSGALGVASPAPVAPAVSTEQATILPSAAPLPWSAVPAGPYIAAPATYMAQPPLSPASPSVPGVLTEAQLEALPGTLTTTPAGLPGGTSVPGVPGGYEVALNAIPGASPFSFLNDIRALDSSVSRVTNSATGDTSAFTDVASLAPEFPAAELESPLIPGAVPRTGDMGDPLAYTFLREARPLLSFEGIPTLEPLDYAVGPVGATNTTAAPFDVDAVRRDFPILEEQINGRQLVWLDNAATTQKPQAVIDRITYYYQHENSNIHRAAHTLAARSTDAFEGARDKTARFLNASSARDIIFVRGATEGINLIAQTWGRKNIQKDDEIVITWLEHHANIVPWQMLCAEKGARLKVAPVDNDGQVLLDEYEKLLGPKTKLVSVAHVSNALGTITPVRELVAAAHRYGARVIVDGAQAISHMPVDVQLYDCDFYVLSGHKVFAPTGIGAVYGKPEVLEHMPPWQGGGNMIVDVTFEKTIYQAAPGRFEAGTGSIAPAVGLGAAIDYLTRLGMHNIARYEHDLLQYAIGALKAIPGLHLIGAAPEKASVLSFVLDGFRSEDVGAALNREGIATRSGHHCAQPILRRFGLESTVRPSLALYNTCEEIDKLVAAIWNLKQGRNPGLT